MDNVADNLTITAEIFGDASPKTFQQCADDELVARVRGGDEAAFEILFERHRQRVAKVAGRFFRRREQLEDVVQETFVKAYFALNSYAGGHEHSFIAWLARIATNVAYDALRREQRAATRNESELSEAETALLAAQLTSDSTEQSVEDKVIARDLADKMLARLDADDRFVLTLLSDEELSVSEIARITGWTTAKVKVRAHRARHALRRLLSKFL